MRDMKGIYWLILGLCVWFIPSIVFQIVLTSESDVSAEEAVSEIPQWFVIVLFATSLPIIIKGVMVIRKERKIQQKDSSEKKRRK